MSPAADPYRPLQTRDYGYPESWVTIDGDRLCYVDAGRGPETIVFVHGLGANISRWRPLLDYFSSKCRVVAYDQPGFGKSDKPDGPYSIEFLHQRFWQFVKALNMGSFHMVGHSLGGAVTLNALIENPGPIKKAAVLAPAGAASPMPAWQRFLARGAVNYLTFSGFYEQRLRRTLYIDNAWTRDMLQTASRLSEDPEWPLLKRSTLRVLHNLLKFSLKPRLSRIRTPLLVVWGEEDTLLSARLAQSIHRRIPAAWISLIPECGHFPQLEQPEKVCEVLEDFLLKDVLQPEGCEHGIHGV